MRGHVRKRGATWAVVVDVGRDPDTGKRRQRWTSGYKRRKDAEKALSELLSRLDGGAYVQPSKVTMADYLDGRWLPAMATQVRPSTLGRMLSAAPCAGLHTTSFREGTFARPTAGVSAR